MSDLQHRVIRIQPDDISEAPSQEGPGDLLAAWSWVPPDFENLPHVTIGGNTYWIPEQSAGDICTGIPSDFSTFDERARDHQAATRTAPASKSEQP